MKSSGNILYELGINTFLISYYQENAERTKTTSSGEDVEKGDVILIGPTICENNTNISQKKKN